MLNVNSTMGYMGEKGEYQTHPIQVFTAAHYLLPEITTPQQKKQMENNDVLIVEWCDKPGKDYAKFVKKLNVKKHKINVNIPEDKLPQIIKTGDISCIHPYEKQKAQKIYDYISKNKHKKLGLLMGGIPWQFTQKIFQQKAILYKHTELTKLYRK